MSRLTMLVALAVVAPLVAPAPVSAGGGCPAEGEPTAGRGSGGSTVPIESCMFTPTVVFVEPGDEVTWFNRDPVPHTVSGAGLSWGDHKELKQEERVSHVFESEGVFPYYCLFHPSMVGAVVVGEPRAIKAAAAPIITDIDEVVNGSVGEAAVDGVPLGAAGAADEDFTWLKALVLVVLSLLAGWALASGAMGPRRGRRSERSL